MSHQRKLDDARKHLRTCRRNEDEAYAEWTQTGKAAHRMAYVEATVATMDAENAVESAEAENIVDGMLRTESEVNV